MHELINKLAFSLFKKNSLEECSIEEIENLAKQYPYFSSAQLLLTAKQKLTEQPGFAKQLSLVSLHVNNPLWLDHLLNNDLVNDSIAKKESTIAKEVNEEPNNDELVLENSRQEFVTPSKSDEPVGTPPPMIEITEQKEQRLVFEPYHTVDYFASQGIRNIVEDKPKDRFSQQLRSFTEWLKTIRQMPTEQIVAMSDGKSDEKVVQLASHSIEDRNVETEAMAEVWIKQGRHEKAIEIYQKLSLLNPSKSSYFALLIEKLKKN